MVLPAAVSLARAFARALLIDRAPDPRLDGLSLRSARALVVGIGDAVAVLVERWGIAGVADFGRNKWRNDVPAAGTSVFR